jgi:hypothetical protein
VGRSIFWQPERGPVDVLHCLAHRPMAVCSLLDVARRGRDRRRHHYGFDALRGNSPRSSVGEVRVPVVSVTSPVKTFTFATLYPRDVDTDLVVRLNVLLLLVGPDNDTVMVDVVGTGPL